MRTQKPTIFFSSSSEAKRLLNHLSLLVTEGGWATPQPWTFNTFELGVSYLEAFKKNTSAIDFAVILYTPDDETKSRGTSYQSPRDNILFELGFFLAQFEPNRVVVVCPQSSSLKFPSDYAGHKVLEYDPSQGDPRQYLASAALQIQNQFQDIWDQVGRRETTSSQVTSLPRTDADSPGADIIFKLMRGQLIPLYRDLSSSLDWFAEFKTAMGSVLPALPSSMLYYGPGLARRWTLLNQDYRAYHELIAAFFNHFTELLDAYVTSDLNVVDLGVGDFRKGHSIIQHLLLSPEVRTLNYFPLDISYEMLAQALNPRRAPVEVQRTLIQLRQKGFLVAINADFLQLDHFCHLFTPPSRNIFLLLGNTLGNELNEVETLKGIARTMTENDVFLAELQLAEEKPASAAEVTADIQNTRDFYRGPFITLGCNSDDIEVEARKDDEEALARGIDAITYQFICRIKRPQTVNHPSFDDGQVRIKPANICTYIVRKYREDAVPSFFEDAGFEVLEYRSTPGQDPRSRRFGYVAAKRGG
jgi:uncharacterized SAM-dependent methyltransferase